MGLGGGQAYCDNRANGSPAQVARKLTGIARNSGWGFGAVELYCWWYTEGSWTWTHTYTNADIHTHTHTIQGTRVQDGGGGGI